MLRNISDSTPILRLGPFKAPVILLSLHALAADVLLSLAAAELAREPDPVLRLTTAIPPVSLDDSLK